MAEPRAEDVARVIGGFYEAADGACSWSSALADLAALFNGPRAWLFQLSEEGLHGHTSVEDAGFASAAAQEVMLRDPLFRLTHRNGAGTLVRHSEMENLDGFRRRALFAEWLQPRDVWYGLQAHLRADGDEHVFIEVSHDRNRGDFTEADKRLLGLLAPHVRRAGDLSALASRGRGAGEEAPLLIVDAGLNLVRINDAAWAEVDRCRNLVRIDRGRLRLCDPALQLRLPDLVADALALSPGRRGGALLAGAEGEAGRVLLSVGPARWMRGFGFRRHGLAAVRLYPVKAGDAEEVARRLGRMFGLQPSHARLASALIDGQSLRRAAADCGLTYASARTYLDHVFRKTGTGRQSELVALMRSLAPEGGGDGDRQCGKPDSGFPADTEGPRTA